MQIELALTLKPMNATELCPALHFCDAYDLVNETTSVTPRDPDMQPVVSSPRRSPGAAGNRRQDLLKVVQLTDVHIDHKYMTVGRLEIFMLINHHEGLWFIGT